MKSWHTKILAWLLCIAMLVAAAPNAAMSGDGTQSSPYIITSEDELFDFAANTYTDGKYFKLGSDIILTKQWLMPAAAFKGYFDGDFHTISGLSITVNDSAGGNYGLFSELDGGVIENLTVEASGVSVTSDSLMPSVGIIAGNNRGLIRNCTVKGNAAVNYNGTSYYAALGGIAGKNSGTLQDCTFTGTISSGNSFVQAGGIVGYNTGTVINCSSEGFVNGINTSMLGGVAGYNNAGALVDSCFSQSTISGADWVAAGGLLGENRGTVQNCYASGAVSCVNYADAGGLVGINSGGLIKNNYAIGNVTSSGADSSLGGLIGANLNDVTIQNCYAVGGVSSHTGGKAGGIAGRSGHFSFTHCYWNSDAEQIKDSAAQNPKLMVGDLAAEQNAMPASQMKAAAGSSGALVDILNENAAGMSSWKQGLSVNNGFPVFSKDFRSTDYTLYFNNGKLYKNRSGSPGSYVFTDEYTEGKAVTWNGSGNELYLYDFNFTTSAHTALLAENAVIELRGASSVTSTYSGASASSSIYAEGSLTLRGSGTLNAQGGDSSGQSSGIYVTGSFGMSECTVNASGGTAPNSLGVSAVSMVLSSGKLNAYGEKQALDFGSISAPNATVRGGSNKGGSGAVPLSEGITTANRGLYKYAGISFEPVILVTAVGFDGLKVGQALTDARVIFTLANGNYIDNVIPADFTIGNLPEGLNAAPAARTSYTTVEIRVSGTPQKHSATAKTLTYPQSVPKVNVQNAAANVPLYGTVVTGAVAKGEYSGVKTVHTTVAAGQESHDLKLSLPDLPEGASYPASGTVSGALISAHSVSGGILTFHSSAQSDGASAAITFTINNAANYSEFDVIVTVTAEYKSPVNVSVTAPEDITYGEILSDPVVFSEGGEGGFTFKYNGTLSDSVGTEYSSAEKPALPGLYTVTAVPEYDINSSYVSDSFTIGKKSLSWTEKGRVKDKTYDGTTIAQEDSAPSLDGVINGDLVETVQGTAVFESANAGQDVEVTAEGYGISGEDAWKYIAPLSQPEFENGTIKPRAVVFEIDEIAALSYTGEEQSPVITVKDGNIILDEDIDYTVLYSNNINAGIGTAAVSGAGNYSGSGGSADFTINKADYGKTIEKTVYITTGNSAAQKGELGVSDFLGDLPEGAVITAVTGEYGSIISAVPALRDGVLSYTGMTNIASGSIASDLLYVTISTDNYNDISARLVFKASDVQEVTISGISIADKTYDGKEITWSGTPSAAKKNGGETVFVPLEFYSFEYISSDGEDFEGLDAPCSAGDYKLLISLSGFGYFGETELEFTIAKKDVTVEPKSESITKDEPLPDFELLYTGLIEGEAVTPGEEPQFGCDGDGKTAGSFTITWTNADETVFDGADNYNIKKNTTAELTVNAKTSGGSGSGGGGGGSGGGSSGGGGGGGSGGGSGSNEDEKAADLDAVVIISDGKVLEAGRVESDGGITIVYISQDTLKELFASSVKDFTIVMPEDTKSARIEFLCKNIEDMASKKMTLNVQTGAVSYIMPAEAVDMGAIKKAFDAADISEVPFTVSITVDVSAYTQRVVKSAVEELGAELVTPPVEFTVSAVYKGKSFEIDRFKDYVIREIELTPEQAEKITTAVSVDFDGSCRHVPTYLYQKNERRYAKISSMTNSAYALIYNEVSFSDARGQWYASAVNEMGSRMILSGTGGGLFDGGRDITRAEFAAIVVRAAGLPIEEDASVFEDVDGSSWYSGAVGAAYKYGIVSGVGERRFAPERSITRQEAMVMISRAAKLAGYAEEGAIGIDSFSDRQEISDWALEAVVFNLAAGLVNGYGGMLKPLDNITRAETASIVLKLLQKAKLIDLRAND